MRRDTGEAYDAWLTRLADASGIPTPTRADLARFDRKRKKKGSNDDWTHPHDPDAKITKMKDGRTHLAHTAEQAVDLETGAVVSVTVQNADAGDTTTLVETLIHGGRAELRRSGRRPTRMRRAGGRQGVSQQSRPWTEFAEISGCAPTSPNLTAGGGTGRASPPRANAVYANRRRIRGRARDNACSTSGVNDSNGPFAHLFETGGMRRTHLRGHPNILKRLLIHVCGFNLGLLMRQLTGIGTPRSRSLQGRAAAVVGALDRPAERAVLRSI